MCKSHHHIRTSNHILHFCICTCFETLYYVGNCIPFVYDGQTLQISFACSCPSYDCSTGKWKVNYQNYFSLFHNQMIQTPLYLYVWLLYIMYKVSFTGELPFTEGNIRMYSMRIINTTGYYTNQPSDNCLLYYYSTAQAYML